MIDIILNRNLVCDIALMGGKNDISFLTINDDIISKMKFHLKNSKKISRVK